VWGFRPQIVFRPAPPIPDDRVLDALLAGRHRTCQRSGRFEERRSKPSEGRAGRAASFLLPACQMVQATLLEAGPPVSSFALEIRVGAVAAGSASPVSRPRSLDACAAVTETSAPGERPDNRGIAALPAGCQRPLALTTSLALPWLGQRPGLRGPDSLCFRHGRWPGLCETIFSASAI